MPMDTRKGKKSARRKSRRIDTITIQIFGDQVTILDYSEHDDRHKVLAMMPACGVAAIEVNESWCG